MGRLHFIIALNILFTSHIPVPGQASFVIQSRGLLIQHGTMGANDGISRSMSGVSLVSGQGPIIVLLSRILMSYHHHGSPPPSSSLQGLPPKMDAHSAPSYTHTGISHSAFPYSHLPPGPGHRQLINKLSFGACGGEASSEKCPLLRPTAQTAVQRSVS